MTGVGAANEPPDARHYARPSAISSMSVSPSGGHAAIVWRVEGRPAVAAVVDLSRPGDVKVVGGFPRSEVQSVGWVNDDRLHFFAIAADSGAELVREGDAGVFAVDRNGENLRQLIDWRWRNEETGSRIRPRVLTYGWRIHASLDDGSADLVVAHSSSDNDNDALPGRLARLNTLDGRLQNLNRGAPAPASGWLLDGAGEPRVVSVERDGRSKLYWRAPGSESWALLEDVSQLSDDRLVPLALEPDGTLVVATSRGGDTTALFSYRPDRRTLEPEPVVSLKGFDVDPLTVVDTRTRRVVGVHTRADGWMSVWFDERLATIQHAVDKSLPAGRVNRLLCGRCESTQRFVVHSWSDRHPGEYYVYDHAARKLQSLGEARPWLQEARHGRRSFHRVAARDGLSLPVVVTHPPAADATRPVPAVVLVHGGPWLRGSSLDWDDDAQFLASRGWRVLQVEFRGSTGFGNRHFRAGWQQWGLAMQDDLADAVAWAARERLVDPARVCIVGASYGGYAALMGPVRHPDTYRCAASFVGVTDLELMFSSRWNDISAQAKRHGLPALLGDPTRDAERLRQSSPLHRVRDIKVPVLLVQGALDRRVPEVHADTFERSARAAGVAIERVDYADEGHGFVRSVNRADYLRRLEAFLRRSLEEPLARR
jgi:acetyl esterase/lipase